MQGSNTSPVVRSANLRAAAWLLGSILLATVMTGSIREASAELPTPMLAFLRTAFGLVMVIPFLFRGQTGTGELRFSLWKHHLARGLLIVVALNAGFFAISRLPLATATILFFLAPVFTTVLAGPILSEQVGPRRWAAVLAGFAGALIILRPDETQIDPAMISAVVSAAAFSMVLLLGKRACRGRRIGLGVRLIQCHRRADRHIPGTAVLENGRRAWRCGG